MNIPLKYKQLINSLKGKDPNYDFSPFISNELFEENIYEKTKESLFYFHWNKMEQVVKKDIKGAKERLPDYLKLKRNYKSHLGFCLMINQVLNKDIYENPNKFPEIVAFKGLYPDRCVWWFPTSKNRNPRLLILKMIIDTIKRETKKTNNNVRSKSKRQR